MIFRTGVGYDVHRLVEGRDLIIGGVTIPHTHGLLGHSDADVLLHAIADALLGAAALGDIGQHFPDEDEQWRGVESTQLLYEVYKSIESAGYIVANVDAVVAMERPKLRPYIGTMTAVIAQILQVDKGQVSVKATTTEGLGMVGREEGVAAWAICMIQSA